MKNSRVTSMFFAIIAMSAVYISFTELSPVISCERGESPALCAQRATTPVK